jgi:hypothetical protein
MMTIQSLPLFGARRRSIWGWELKPSRRESRRRLFTRPIPEIVQKQGVASTSRRGRIVDRFLVASSFTALAGFYGLTLAASARQGGLPAAVASLENAMGFGVSLLGLGLSVFGLPRGKASKK